MDKIKLSYFDIDGGRGEATRIAMSIGGIEFEDDRLAFPKFREMRESTPLNAVPVVDINGTTYTQCNAMNRYFGKLAGLYPSDPWQAFLCDEVLEIMEDMSLAMRKTFGLEGDELVKARQDLMDGPFKRGLQLLDKRLEAAGGEWITGKEFTVADLKLLVSVRHLKSGILDHIPTDFPEKIAPKVVKLIERVAAHPGVVAYYEGRAKN